MSTFALDISKFAEKVRGREDLVVRKIAQDVANKIILMTPVDTGRARANWNVGINSIDPTVNIGVNLSAVQAAQNAIQRAKAIIERVVAGDKIYVTNNVNYIGVLEDGGFVGQGPKITSSGYSIQAPQGMVKVTLRNYPGIVEQGINEAKRQVP